MSRMMTITRRIEWDAAHRVLNHESKCATLHGHHYVALLTVSSEGLDALGRVVDFSVLKARVGGWVDTWWDHTTLVNTADAALVAFTLDDCEKRGKRPPYLFADNLGKGIEPTAENIASRLMTVATDLLVGTGVEVVGVEIFETPNCSAKVFQPPRVTVKQTFLTPVREKSDGAETVDG